MPEQLLKEILGELKVLNQRIGSLEEGQQELVKRVAGLEEGQQELARRVGNLEEGQRNFAGRMERIETRMDKLGSHLNRLELRIEEEIIDKIRALFDGYNLRGDQIGSLRKHLDERLDVMALDINYLVRKTAQQEFVIQELRRAK
ncbi:hypothetical protein G7K71_18385 [Desulfofundulus sp. TPOSR]|jgi:chromosome segregation ATPase|uniref:hypothetical protein n=1 Tax=Desulfofundulus sp. TPOSR TaxID=2714340 RepID=UPI00140AC806|nr:hypothetical protein [Desulfofundulus sp. TPOSR]NHM28892.1 hypothetical protein [Desulfofundulus sp. TPOSR]